MNVNKIKLNLKTNQNVKDKIRIISELLQNFTQ